MIDYYAFPSHTLRRVMHPTRRVTMGCPEPLLTRYYRTIAERKRMGEKNVTDAWFLPGDDLAWNDLLPYADAVKLYDPAPAGKPPSAVMREREALQRRLRLEAYWAQVAKLPGGTDPLWRYGDDDDEPEDDLRYQFFEWTEREKGWYPRLRLRLRYGTTSLKKYAANWGVAYPGAM